MARKTFVSHSSRGPKQQFSMYSKENKSRPRGCADWRPQPIDAGPPFWRKISRNLADSSVNRSKRKIALFPAMATANVRAAIKLFPRRRSVGNYRAQAEGDIWFWSVSKRFPPQLRSKFAGKKRCDTMDGNCVTARKV